MSMGDIAVGLLLKDECSTYLNKKNLTFVLMVFTVTLYLLEIINKYRFDD